MSQLFTWGGQSTGGSASASFLPKKSQGWSPSEWIGWISLQSILKEISPGCSLEALMLKVKLQYFVHSMRRADSLEKHSPMLGKVEGRRRRGWQRMRWLDGITELMDMNEFEQALGVGDGQGSLECCSPWVTKSQTRLSKWTELFLLMFLNKVTVKKAEHRRIDVFFF